MNVPSSYNSNPLVHTWPYHDSSGKPLGIVARYQANGGKKDIVPFFNGNNSPGIPEQLNSKRPLFGLQRLSAHEQGRALFVVEGEKSAAALQQLGICAVTSIGGANAADKADWTPLNGYNSVIITPDNDDPGEHYAQAVYTALTALESPPVVKVLHLAGLPLGGDVVDWVQAFIVDWDGYAPLPENSIKPLREELAAELKNAKPPPDEWGFSGLRGSSPSCFEWEKPNEIETRLPAVMPFAVELIPEPLRPWLADVAYRMQTPPDFSAISSIVMMGSVIGAGCSIKPKRLDGWEVIPNVWGACIGRPSVVLKSPSMKEPMQLLERLQAEYGELHEAQKIEADFLRLTNEAMLNDVKGQIAKLGKGSGKDRVVNPDDMQKLKADYLEIAKATEPEATLRLFKTNETSIQSMTLLQNQNPRGLLVFRDELTALLAKWDKDDGADERAYFLEGWNGNGSYTDFKIGRGLTDAKSVCISLLGGIQPDKLKRYLYQAQKGNNDGLMQRLQLAVWPDEPEHWQLIDTTPKKADKQRAYSILQALAELDFIQCGALMGEYDDRPYFRFDEAGQAIFNEWLTELQTIKIRQEENPLMAEHFGKFRSLMPSLALIFHCIDIADGKAQGNVSAKAALLAVKWCEYLESHARRIYAMAESPEHEAAVRLATKIKAKALPSPFTAHDIYHKGWHGLKDRQEVEAAINVLIDGHWLTMQRKPKPATGRPPAPEYFINPFFN